MRSLSKEEALAFGRDPRPIDAPLGLALGACDETSTGAGGWIVCQRFEHLTPERPVALFIATGLDLPSASLEVLDADMPDPRGPQDPILARLVRRAPNFTETGVSWRSALLARPGNRYTFELTLPSKALLVIGTGHEPGALAGPARFTIHQDGMLLLDEIVAPDLKWHDHEIPLLGRAGSKTLLTLESSAVSGSPGEVRGLWADPRVLGASPAPSILLITVDALRADHLSALGYARDTSPSLAHLAALGATFERATAQACQTWESLTSLFTGLHPARNGVRKRGLRLSPDIQPIGDLFSNQGYDTFAGTDLAFFPAVYLSAFDESEIIAGKVKPSPRKQFLRIRDRFKAYPTLAWFHLEQTHYPLVPVEPLRYARDYHGPLRDGVTEAQHALLRAGQVSAAEQEHIIALYDSAIRDADAEIHALLTLLIEAAAWENTIVVVTADHGEHLGEHGVVLDHVAPYDEVLHVPLFISWPEKIVPGTRVHARVQLIDVLPTLLSLAGAPLPKELDGRDLSPALRGQRLPDAPAFAELGGRIHARYSDNEKTIINPGNFVYQLETGIKSSVQETELYDLSADPGELRNLARVDPARAAAAVSALQRALREQEGSKLSEQETAIGQAASDALRQAGYLHK